MSPATPSTPGSQLPALSSQLEVESREPTAQRGPSPQSLARRDPIAAHACRRWIIAGLAGMTFCVAIASSRVFAHLSAPVAASLTIACGWLMLLLMSPWRLMRRLAADQRPLMGVLRGRLESIAGGSRDASLRDLIIEGDDELSALSRAVHDLAAQTHAQRHHARRLEKQMGHDIQRETRKATAHLERAATTDPLTGLGNRRALAQQLAELTGPCGEGDRGAAHGAAPMVAVIAIDLDRFKEVNDSLGHEVGDQCLIFLAEVMRTSLRRGDSAIRLGGDEFIVLMPGATPEIARAVGSRLAALYTQMPWPHAKVPRPTMSFGVAWQAAGPRSQGNGAELLRRADAALYAAKHASRAAPSGLAERRGAA